mmetsp:Transcript_64167/g.139656  ORF Transcript_64167/g.139656 Transcript_64167/m.139656 type:complete len:158 (+) Transcript_64167:1372-1845(+)
MAFHESEDTLVVATADNRFVLFDVGERCVSGWSREFGDTIPTRLSSRPETIAGVMFDPAADNALVLWGHNFLCNVDLGKPIPPDDAEPAPSKARKRKSKKATKEGEVTSRNCGIVEKKTPLMHATFIGPRTLHLVERPWLEVMATFGTALQLHRYGR